MSPEIWLGLAALSVALIGHIINFAMLMLHCRRDRRAFSRLDADRP